MNTKTETVSDIIAETVRECDRATEQTTWNRHEVERILRRIEEAHNREILKSVKLVEESAELVIDCKSEKIRLRETVCRLYRSLNGICQWTRCAQEHLPPFGNDYRGAIDCVHAEAEAAIAANAEFAAEALKGVTQ